MTDLPSHLRLCGAALVMLCMLHFFFPRRFRWREELALLSTVKMAGDRVIENGVSSSGLGVVSAYPFY